VEIINKKTMRNFDDIKIPKLNQRDGLWFNLYELKNTWVLTHPKIASSYMDFYQRSHPDEIMQMSVHFQEEFLGINTIQKTTGTLRNPVKFRNDWTSLLQGKEIDKQIIFLTRNPIQKFITGLVQDFVLTDLDKHIVKTPWFRDLMIKEKHEPVLVDSFIRRACGVYFPDLSSLSLYHKDIYESSIKFTLDKILNDSGFKKTFDVFTNGHMFQSQLELYDFIMNPPTEFNISAIKILDINKEDLQLTLESFGETTPPQITNERKFNSHPHKRSPIIQETVRHILSKHGDMINQLLLPNLYGWINLLKITYPTDTSDKKATIDNPIHTLEKFQSQQYLNNPFKEYSDIFKPELYLSWSDKEYCKLNLYNKNTI